MTIMKISVLFFIAPLNNNAFSLTGNTLLLTGFLLCLKQLHLYHQHSLSPKTITHEKVSCLYRISCH